MGIFPFRTAEFLESSAVYFHGNISLLQCARSSRVHGFEFAAQAHQSFYEERRLRGLQARHRHAFCGSKHNNKPYFSVATLIITVIIL